MLPAHLSNSKRRSRDHQSGSPQGDTLRAEESIIRHVHDSRRLRISKTAFPKPPRGRCEETRGWAMVVMRDPGACDGPGGHGPGARPSSQRPPGRGQRGPARAARRRDGRRGSSRSTEADRPRSANGSAPDRKPRVTPDAHSLCASLGMTWYNDIAPAMRTVRGRLSGAFRRGHSSHGSHREDQKPGHRRPYRSW